MNANEKLFLEALGCAISGRQTAWQDGIGPGDWRELLKLAKLHKVLPLLLEAVYACPAIAGADPADMAEARQNVRAQVMVQARRTTELLRLYPRLTAGGVDALVVKGIVCRELYPQPDLRPSSDEDILIPGQHYKAAKKTLGTLGYVPGDPAAEENGSYEVPFHNPRSPLHIELHKELFSQSSLAYGEMAGLFAHVQDDAVEITVMGTTIRTPAPTDHLFYLICHAFKHFLHSGFGIRQVCDIVLFANRWGKDVRWEELLESCQNIRAEKFALALFRIGEEFLTFDPEAACFPNPGAYREVNCQALLEDLLRAGIYGDADMSRKHSSNITLDAVAAQKQGRKAKGSLRSSLFPPAKSLSGRYTYLKGKPWLLPVAWASRMAEYAARGQNAGNRAAESLRIGRNRVELMRKYGIID